MQQKRSKYGPCNIIPKELKQQNQFQSQNGLGEFDVFQILIYIIPM
jgi:hypothetical protein